MPRVAQMAARFLFVESCNQCSACKHGLRTASTALDALFDSKRPQPELLARARYGAVSAPQGNRCYLPVEGAAIVSGILSRFGAEFQQYVREPGRTSRPVPIPKIVDWDETLGTFVLDERQQYKRPDWTYESPHTPRGARARPAVLPHDEGHVSVRLPPELVALLRTRSDAQGLSLETLVERALAEWLNHERS
jgi:hypothetical protein